MLKKALFVVGGLGLLGTLFFGRECASYMGTSIGWVRQSISDNTPIEFQLERARELCEKLDKPIERNMHLIAKEEVEAERLAKEIARADAKINKEESDMLKLRTDLSDGQQFYVYAGRKYTKKQVETDLTRRLARFKTGRDTLDSLRETHQARLRGLAAAREKLTEMQAAQRQLQVDVENLAARQKMVEVAQTTSELGIDDSELGLVRQMVGDLQARIATTEKLANASDYFRNEIPVSHPGSIDVVADFDEYFEQDRPRVEEIASEPITLD
jgi:chromosome segregation ATPase